MNYFFVSSEVCYVLVCLFIYAHTFTMSHICHVEALATGGFHLLVDPAISLSGPLM